MRLQKGVDHTKFTVVELNKKIRPVGPIPYPPPKVWKYGETLEDGSHKWIRQPIKYEKMQDLWSMRTYSIGQLIREELNYWYPFPTESLEEQVVQIEDEDKELDDLYSYLFKRVVSNEFEEANLKDTFTELIA